MKLGRRYDYIISWTDICQSIFLTSAIFNLEEAEAKDGLFASLRSSETNQTGKCCE